MRLFRGIVTGFILTCFFRALIEVFPESMGTVIGFLCGVASPYIDRFFYPKVYEQFEAEEEDEE